MYFFKYILLDCSVNRSSIVLLGDSQVLWCLLRGTWEAAGTLEPDLWGQKGQITKTAHGDVWLLREEEVLLWYGLLRDAGGGRWSPLW